MLVYRISDIINVLDDMKKDGFEYVSLSILEPDDDCPEETLSIDAVVSESDSENEMIDSVTLPENYYLNQLS